MKKKQILLISTCLHKLHELEFVKPIENIILNLNYNNVNSISYTTIYINSKILENKEYLKKFSHIIICGTAIKDFEYLNSNYLFFLDICKSYSIKVLGICAGAQLLSKYHNLDLVENKKNDIIEVEVINECPEIGIFKYNKSCYKVYALYSLTLKVNEELSKGDNINIIIIEKESKFVEFAKIDNFYISFFHPEIKNKEIIEKFISNT